MTGKNHHRSARSQGAMWWEDLFGQTTLYFFLLTLAFYVENTKNIPSNNNVECVRTGFWKDLYLKFPNLSIKYLFWGSWRFRTQINVLCTKKKMQNAKKRVWFQASNQFKTQIWYFSTKCSGTPLHCVGKCQIWIWSFFKPRIKLIWPTIGPGDLYWSCKYQQIKEANNILAIKTCTY